MGFQTLNEVAQLLNILTEKMNENPRLAVEILTRHMLDNFLKSIAGYITIGDLTQDDQGFMFVRSEFLSAIHNIINVNDESNEYGFDAIMRTIGFEYLTQATEAIMRQQIKPDPDTIERMTTAFKIIG